jgi:hypothetical protein
MLYEEEERKGLRIPMWRSTEQRILKRLQLRESWVIFFVLGNVMLNFPFMKIFNQPTTVMGLPLMYLYFTVGWAISIGVIYLFVSSVEPDSTDHQSDEQERP